MKTLSSRWSSALCLGAFAWTASTSYAQCPFATIPLRSGTSTWTQQCDGVWSPGAVVDANPGSAWAIGDCYAAGDRTLSQTFVAETAPSPDLAVASRVRIRIHTGGYYACCGGGYTNLGAFRIAVTDDARTEFADGRAVSGDVAARWYTVQPDALSAAAATPWGVITAAPAPTLSMLDDDVILASGANPVCSWYTIEAELPIYGITGVRLELIDLNGASSAAAEGLPTGGPGRHNNGNVLIRQMTVEFAAGSIEASAPQSVLACVGGEARFAVTTITPGVSFQWRRNGENIPGATGAAFTLKDVAAEDAGLYDCVLTTACAAVVTDPAALWFCAAEFNCDGVFDLFDYEAFVEAFEAGDPRADLEPDGFIDLFDYIAFVEEFENGC